MPKGVYKHKPSQFGNVKGKHWKLSEQAKKNISIGGMMIHRGVKNGNWKADSASIAAMHRWVETWKGKPKQCEMCGRIDAKKYEWANKDHQYKRILEDYIRMCVSCHRKYDIETHNYRGFKK